MNGKPFWMKAADVPMRAPVTETMMLGPAVSQAEAEAVDCEGAVVAATALEVLPPEALACVNVQGLAAATASQLKTEFRAAFGDAASVLEQAATVQVTDVGQTAYMEKAKALRLRLKAIRCNVEKVRKYQKADSLMRGKVIDGIANALKGLIEPAEAWLLEQEQFAERADKLRRDQTREQRAALLAPFGMTPSVDLAELTPEAFEAMLEGAKMQAQLRAEAERMEAEARRVAEEARADRERENEKERLRLKAENDRLLAEQKVKDEENARLLAAQKKAEADRLAKVAADKAEADRQAEIERKAASAPDKEKALAFVATLRALVFPELKSPEGKSVAMSFTACFDQLIDELENSANERL